MHGNVSAMEIAVYCEAELQEPHANLDSRLLNISCSLEIVYSEVDSGALSSAALCEHICPTLLSQPVRVTAHAPYVCMDASFKLRTC